MSKRCSCYAITTKLKCKNNYSFIFNNKKYCYIHAKTIFYKYATFIQSFWKGQKIRNKINNIYIKLPYDLQLKINFYIRESYLLEKYHYSIIRNILDKKVNTNIINNIYNNIHYHIYDDYFINSIIYIRYLYNLYNKYYKIASLDKVYILKKFVFKLKYINTEFIYNLNLGGNLRQKIKMEFAHLKESICIFQTIYC